MARYRHLGYYITVQSLVKNIIASILPNVSRAIQLSSSVKNDRTMYYIQYVLTQS